MSANTYKSNTYKSKKSKKSKSSPKIKMFGDKRLHLTLGFFLAALSIFLFISFLSYLFTYQSDQSVVQSWLEVGVRESGAEVNNWLGLLGAAVSHFFIFKWFGIASFLIPPLLALYGHRILTGKHLIPLWSSTVFGIFFLFWISLLLGYMVFRAEDLIQLGFLCGGIGFELAVFFNSLVGWGTFLVLGLSLIVFLIYFFNITSIFGLHRPKEEPEVLPVDEQSGDELLPVEETTGEVHLENSADLEAESWVVKTVDPETGDEDVKEELSLEVEETTEEPSPEIEETEAEEVEGPEFTVEEQVEEETSGEVEYYDPTLDLGTYRYPSLNLLNKGESDKVQVTKEELEHNKDRIVETLVNFKIGISSIKATIGPTVTLYEIVPDAGVKISRIRNLEDDIALNLSALGIRIIAPIPGKGTIGIEVPNKNREIVYVGSVLATDKFTKSEMDLPIILGKTISNEVFMTDLTKMPHILMAGATGQGKSVGLNVIITSLIYKKHPSQLKFVLVDPKKVELSLFNKLERHFLAKLPDVDEAIITDTRVVVRTLNSLCIEMDNRYNLLKDAGTRNLKEYNAKFVERKLNPQKGHRFLPYIVLIIDELADLMMISGKEVEAPIARIAQLARAIGIHMVVATQRPSVNVITGIIKANFPARISFRVTSSVDSRTILDHGGAERLVGLGDFLFSQGSDILRLQSPFVDTHEVEKICDFIGSQRGYESAYNLPEYDDDQGGPGDVDLSDRDALFEDAARLIVLHQQGSTSLIQRKLKLGYNRAGRLIDQLEAAGIVGPFEGSKAREVLIQDEQSLEQLLNDLD